MMANQAGISVSSAPRIRRVYGLNRMRRFKPSTDPDFIAKLRDVAGLCVDQRPHAIVLSLDEKSQIQALDGTTIGGNMQRPRDQQFIRVLNTVEREVRLGKLLHVILDN